MKSVLKRLIQWVISGVPNKVVNATIVQAAPNKRLQGVSALITGGGKGIGLSIAQKCVSEGASVIICGRTESVLQEASSKMGNIPYLVFDVRDISSFDTIFEKAESLIGSPINALVNNAGISLHEQSFLDVTEAGYDNQFLTNLKGPYFLTQSFIKYIKKKHISSSNTLFISSERGFYCDTIPYGLTKIALNSLVQGLSCRYIDKGFRFNAIAPGVTVSGMTNLSSNDNLYRERSYGRRVFLPEEIAETAVFLLSDSSQCISGEIIPCNHGSHLKNDYK